MQDRAHLRTHDIVRALIGCSSQAVAAGPRAAREPRGCVSHAARIFNKSPRGHTQVLYQPGRSLKQSRGAPSENSRAYTSECIQGLNLFHIIYFLLLQDISFKHVSYYIRCFLSVGPIRDELIKHVILHT